MTSLFRKPKQQQETIFAYNTLHTGEVRLLKLRPSDSKSAAPAGNLITVRFHDLDAEEIPQYEALSYVWGTEPADRSILLDNTHFAIKPNLEAALKVLNKGKAERLLWIDSICLYFDRY